MSKEQLDNPVAEEGGNAPEEQNQEGVDILNMSDEELANFDLNSIEEPEAEEPVEEDSSEEEESTEEENDETEEDDSDSEEEDNSDDQEEDESETEEEGEEPDSEEDKEEEPEVNYKEIVDDLFKPFKANGSMMEVNNVEDVRTLMKMGANYNKKMAGLKPNLKIIKQLANNDLLDENKLNFLIDINNKNPEAIKKLIKDSGMNPLEIDVEEDTDYKPNSYNASDSEVDLDLVLEDIKGTDTYQDTMNVVSTKWDDASKRIIVSNPEIIRTINDHKASGIFDKIDTVMQSERMLGKLTGKSDVEAYREIGQRLYEAGAFNDTSAPNKQEAKTTEKKKVVEKAKPNKDLGRKKAAAVTKAKAATKTDDDFNPLALSDEEFEKQGLSKFL